MTMSEELITFYFRNGVLVFLVVQGIVMFLQNLYQSKRHYTRVAIGKASTIDVAASETLVETPSNLRILVPLLFLTYILELISGGIYLASSLINIEFHWQVFINGIL